MSSTAAASRIPEPPPRSRRLSTRLLVALVVLAALWAADLSRPAPRQISTRFLLGAIHLYQRTLSPRMPGLGVRCRFTPTCSHYAEAVIARDGALRGGLESVWRVLRCGPWTPQGTVDPP